MNFIRHILTISFFKISEWDSHLAVKCFHALQKTFTQWLQSYSNNQDTHLSADISIYFYSSSLQHCCAPWARTDRFHLLLPLQGSLPPKHCSVPIDWPKLATPSDCKTQMLTKHTLARLLFCGNIPQRLPTILHNKNYGNTKKHKMSTLRTRNCLFMLYLMYWWGLWKFKKTKWAYLCALKAKSKCTVNYISRMCFP